MILLENCELGEDQTKGGGKKKYKTFFIASEKQNGVTNRIEVGQPRKIFQGETGCKKGWKKAHSIPPRLFNRRGNSYRPVQQLPSRNSSQFTYTIDNYFSFPLKKKKKTIFISRKLHPKIKGNIFTKLKISLLQKKEKFETRSCKTIIFLTNENRLVDE